MEKQRERARAGHKFSGDKSSGKDKATVIYKPDRTNFVGYDKLKTSSKVSYILDQESGQSVKSAKKGQKVAVVLEATPFYGEMGGQVGDTGRITADSSQIDITDTVWSPYGNLAEGAIVHLGQVVKDTISVGDTVEAKVDTGRRLDIARNHTATHLLQAALRQVLGSNVQQRRSEEHTSELQSR